MKLRTSAALLGLTSICWTLVAFAAESPSCDQFRERLLRAESMMHTPVPRFHFRDVEESGKQYDGDHEFAIENAKGIDGQLKCHRKDGKFSSLQINVVSYDGTSAKDSTYTAARFLISMHAMTWAYTQWPQNKIKTVLERLRQEAYRNADKEELRGGNQSGTSTFDVNDDVTLNYSAGGGVGLTFMIDGAP
jgi:hypothetical protein